MNIKMIRWLLVFSVTFAGNYQVTAQSSGANEFKKIVDFLPPPPNAAAITKAGYFNLNKNTGAPNVNIPLYTLKQGKLSMGIGLNYATNGIKVDEIASRVGMGWSLNAGGVIARIIRGGRDEAVPRATPWAPVDINWSTFNFMKEVSLSTNYVGVDAEPDLFSFNFNGVSGSFVFDGNMNVVQMPYGNLKIEYDFATSATWNFKITTGDGVMYYFGGSTATEKTKRENTCGKNFDDFFATSWYLKKVEHPDGDVIQLNYSFLEYTYETGMSETKELVTFLEEGGVGATCANGSGPQFNVNTCINSTRTKGYILSSINAATATVNFNYTTRTDCSDYLINGITVINNIQGTAVVKGFDLLYDHVNEAPYLATLREKSSDGTAFLNHQFQYNDPGARPARLSKSQDHWGFYNGKTNSTLLPYLKELQQGAFVYYSYFTSANADRTSDFTYASKGMLTKIYYPTGGMDSILYEPNGGEGTPPAVDGAKTYFTCEKSGSGHHDPEYRYIPFQLKAQQTITLDISILSANPDWDPAHQLGTVSIAPSGSANVFYEVYQPGTTITKTVSLPAGFYTLTLRANGSDITTRTKITYHTATNIPSPSSGSPGVRVKGILTGNPNEIPLYKKYYYAYLDNLQGSSLNGSFAPKYLKSYQFKQLSLNMVGDGVYSHECVFEHTMLYSNSIRNLFIYSSSAVSYASVVESIGENFEGGGSETRYMVGWDQMGAAAWNNDILDAPFTNGSIFYNGKVLRETVVKKASDGSLFPVKKTEYVYKEDERGFKAIDGYVVFRRGIGFASVDTACYSTVVPDHTNFSCWFLLNKYLGAFDMMHYIVFAPWVYLDSTKETLYDQYGANPLTTVTKSYYDDAIHQQLTRTETTNSKSELIKTTLQYPSDYASGSNVYAQMVNKHIIVPVVDTKTERNTTPLSEVKIHFATWSNSIIQPSRIEKSIRGNVLENEGEITGYDDQGNITEYKGRDGVLNAVIWGYNNTYPVAKISGAGYSQCIAQLSVTVTALQSLDGTALLTELHRIRTGLPATQVTTYVYKPNIGVTTIVDPNNRASYYEYDAFGRLKLIRDKENNILKKNEYQYTGSDVTGTLKIYLSQPINQPFICQKCISGTKGSTVYYGASEGKFFSLVSQADADAQALAYVQTNGQLNANANGYCDNTLCSGAGYAVINCTCELGKITGVSCSDNPDGTWIQNYKYKYSDNSLSADTYTRTLPACTGPDKKKIGCDCLIGIKIYTATYQNANGTWTCVFHYRWSADNTNSQNYTEITEQPCGPE